MPGGTGKTTVCEDFIKQNQSFEYVPEGVREYLKENNISKDQLREMTIVESMQMQEYLLDKKLELAGKDNFISDRTPIDNLAYMLRWCTRSDMGGMQTRYKNYFNKAINLSNSLYDLIIYFPPLSIPYEPDGVRSRYPWSQVEIGYLMYGLLINEFEIGNNKHLYIMDSCDRECRVNRINELVSSFYDFKFTNNQRAKVLNPFQRPELTTKS